MRTVLEAIEQAFGDFRFICIYVACLVAVLVFFRGKRKRFAIPAVLITAAIANPLFYRVWAKMNEAMVYWRTLWMVPLLPVCAAAIAMIVDRSRRTAVKIVAIIVGSGVIMLSGGFVYTEAYPPRTFAWADNADKLPKDVADVGKALLEISEEPYIVADGALSPYLRQYSGRIHSPYSRSVFYGAPSKQAVSIYNALASGDYGSLATSMANYDYEYLVTENRTEGKEEGLAGAGFEPLKQVGDYGIYRNHHPRTEKRTYNDLHQVTSVSYVDEDGKPVNGSDGYATLEYAYDEYGGKVYEFCRDAEGNGVADNLGRAGYRRELNYLGQVVSEIILDVNGNRAITPYSKRTCEYDGSHRLARESYFDENDQPMIREDTGYASIEFIRDRFGSVIEERTYGTGGELAPRYDGYSILKMTFDDQKRSITKAYYDALDRPLDISIGYHKQFNEYNAEGQLSLSWFYDTQGNRIDCGSSYFHEYLQSIDRRDKVILISIKDDGTRALTPTLLDDLAQLGAQTDLRGKYRNSYCAVITPEGSREEISADHEVSCEGEVDGTSFTVASAGYLVGNRSSIVIDGTEYSKNVRGMNMVIYDLNEKTVTESIAFDTYQNEMKVTR